MIFSIWPDQRTIQVCGLIFSDAFTRADSDSPGSPWVEVEADVDIASNMLLLQGSLNRPNAYVDLPRQKGGFIQFRARWNNATVPAFGGLYDKAATLNKSGYQIRIDDNAGLLYIERFSNFNTLVTIATAAGSWSTGTWYDMQLAVHTDGTIRGFATSDGGLVSVSGTDTTHAANPLTMRLNRGFSNLAGRTCEFDDALWCACDPAGEYITVTGMSTGYKAKVRDSGASIVAQATESGGIASVDCSLGNATQIVPLAGWTDIIITDASDVTQKTITGPIYPGEHHVGA